MYQCSRRKMLGLVGGIVAGGAIAGLAGPAWAATAGTKSGATALYPKTFKSLMAAVAFEVQANANYLAFADAADKDGHREIAAIFRAIAAAELKHANDEFAIAQSLISSAVKPKAEKAALAGSTAANLQAAIAGETEEYTKIYPGFVKIAQAERMRTALGIFTIAKLAEEVHAGIYADLLKHIDKFDREKYAKVYRCPVCGNIVPTVRPMACPICGDEGEDLIEYTIVG